MHILKRGLNNKHIKKYANGSTLLRVEEIPYFSLYVFMHIQTGIATSRCEVSLRVFCFLNSLWLVSLWMKFFAL